MKIWHYLIIVISLFSNVLSFAQTTDKRAPLPDLQTKRETFFDPDKEKPKEEYRFKAEWRIEAGYDQTQHRTRNATYPNLFLHGAKLGFTVDFMLPKRFSLQTGLFYTFNYGSAMQKFGPMSYEDFTTPDPVTGLVHSGNISHKLYEHRLAVPVYVYYNVRLWRELNMFFFTGPQLQIGVALRDNLNADVSTKTREWLRQGGLHVESYDRYKENELYRAAVQWSVGGGFEWSRYRLLAGYSFGLNNEVKTKRISNQQMWEWSWFVSVAFRL